MNPKDKHADWLLKPTANELADLIENEDTLWLEGRLSEIATMLRQQQAEIEALKQIIDANNLNQNIGQFVKPTNEPVAWMHQNPDYAISKHQSLEYNIPLYTHPVELTDDEIMKLYDQDDLYNIDEGQMYLKPIEFARAILRKAQE